MASDAEIEEPGRRRGGLRIGCAGSVAMALILLAGFLVLWLNRERIADNFIAAELERMGLPASYEVEKIAGQHQVLRNIVIGDPERPDLTIERAEVTLRYGFGVPTIAELQLTRPRLYGTFHGGKLSFGALDPVVFTGSDEPFTLPDMRLRIADGRALLDSDNGRIGISLRGGGWLRGGFSGELAATAPLLTLPGCKVEGTSLYGRVSIRNARPGFEGPVRIAGLECPEASVALGSATLKLDAQTNEAFDRIEGDADLTAVAGRVGQNRLASLTGDSDFTWRDGGLTAAYSLQGTGLEAAGVGMARLDAEGSLRARGGFARVELESELNGRGVRLGDTLDSALASAQRSTADTLLAPLLGRMRGALAAQGRNSSVAAEVTLRRADDALVLVAPSATLRGSNGEILLSLSRVQGALSSGKAPRLSGAFASGGRNLPRIAGQLDQQSDGSLRARMSIAEYASGDSSLSIPDFAMVREPGGAMGFSGQVRASGAVPGGFAENLILPVSGNWSDARGLALWRDCTELRFDGLRFASLELDGNGLTLCPARGSAIVRYGDAGLRVAAGAPALALDGNLGETPIAIRSGPVGFAWPGALTAREIDVTLGPAETATKFALSDLSAQIGDDISGRFSGADVRLFAVPLDLLGANGAWRFADGMLSLSEGSFRVHDRAQAARFEPLEAEGATLTLVDNRITARAPLREPLTGRTVTNVDIVHDLSTSRGRADLAVPGLVFDGLLQPETLTQLAFGLIAETRGKVTGRGRIEWDENSVRSTGHFSSEALDFAAAFGPVKGASGTVVFTDLLGLTTAPAQSLRLQSVNPGIEVMDGTVSFQLRGGEVLVVEGARWPFMGGTLTMRPVNITFGASEVRRYVFEVEGLDAGRFIERMELGNISATGTFDGTVPIVFDAMGFGHLEDGILLSREPGGNVSYVGELTYEDLGTMANLAFDALRSLDYRQMMVTMDGDLAGEIITSVRMDGVSQGVGAKRNLLTRAVSGLPIRLDVNIRAQFYTLMSNLRSLYDPAAVKDPRSADVGLLDVQGNRIPRDANGNPLPAPRESPTPDDNLIQRRESEENP